MTLTEPHPRNAADDFPTMTPTFSDRQREVIAGIHRGDSYKEIGATLCISPHTVRATVVQIANKIDAFPELPPRWRILAYTKIAEWESTRAA